MHRRVVFPFTVSSDPDQEGTGDSGPEETRVNDPGVGVVRTSPLSRTRRPVDPRYLDIEGPDPLLSKTSTPVSRVSSFC